MKVAAVITNDGQTVMPLVQGERIRIRDLESKEEFEIQNPAMSVTTGRRMAVVKALLENGVDTVISPPEAFCAHSYGVAKANELKFWRVAVGATWSSLWNGVEASTDIMLVQELPEDELASHGHHHHRE